MAQNRSNLIDSVQMLRAVAILGVLLFHATEQWRLTFDSGGPQRAWVGGIFSGGWFGVDLFFCISGFIIMWVHGDDLGRPERAQIYALRRLIRIVPPYFVITLAKAGFYLVSGNWGASTVQPSLRLLQSFLFTPGEPVVSVAWTLVYEMFFYTCFCIAIVLPRRLSLILCGAWILAVFVAAGSLEASQRLPQILYSPYNLEFLAGVAAAVAARRFAQGPLAWICAVLGPLAYVATFQASHWIQGRALDNLDKSLGPRLALAVAGGITLFGWVALERRLKFAIPRWVLYLGGASYSLYLVHNEFLTFMCKGATWLARKGHLNVAHSEAGFFFLVLGSCLACILCGLVYFRIVEKPLLRLGRQRLAAAVPEKGTA